jgi:hypothetical protein
VREEALDEVSLAVKGVIARGLRRRFPERVDGHSILSVDGVGGFPSIVEFVAENVLNQTVCGERLGA